MRLGIALLIVLSAFASPMTALAMCQSGAALSYDDIDAIAVRRCGVLPVTYYFDVTKNGDMVLDAKHGTPILGGYQAFDGGRLFKDLVRTLAMRQFFSMRLKESPTVYIDGPCETVKVQRCGVTTAIAGLGNGLPFEADLTDTQTKAFDDLINELQAQILAWPWGREQLMPTPSPKPS